MKCNKHKGGSWMVMHAFSQGPCKVCGEEVVTAHTPCDEVCKKCSEENELCTVCGADVNKFSPEYMNYVRDNGFVVSEEEYWRKITTDRDFYNKHNKKDNKSKKAWVRLPNGRGNFIIPKKVADYIKFLEAHQEEPF